MNRVVLAIVLIFISCSVRAQQYQWGLDECLAQGKQHSYRVLVAALETKVAEKQKQSVVSYFLPEISASAGQSFNFGSTIDPSSNSRVSSNIQSTQMSLGAEVSLFNYSDLLSHQQAQLAVDYASLSEAEVWYHYQLRLLSLFYDIVSLQEFIEIQEQQLINSEANYVRVQKEVEAGAKPTSDFYDIEHIFNNERISIQQSENTLYNTKLSLLHHLNRQDVTPNEFTLVQETEVGKVVNEYSFSPVLEKAKLRQQQLEKTKQIIRARYLPKLSGSYQFGSFFSKPFDGDIEMRVTSFSKQMGDNKSHYVGFNLSVPIFQGGSVRRALKVNQAEALVNEKKMAEVALNLTQENELILKEIDQVNQLTNHLKKNIELSEKSFFTTQVKYENGKVDIFSFNAAKNQLLNSQYTLIKNDLNRLLLLKKLQLNNTNEI